MAKGRQEQSVKGAVLGLLAKIAVFALIIWCGLTFVFGLIRIRGNAMFPMAKDGDLCIFSRLESYGLGDMVFYLTPDGTLTAGRIAALPGHTVDFPEGGGYTVDGSVPGEEVPYETYADPDADMTYPLHVEDGQYFILNELRSDTKDSRSFGCITDDAIKGKTVFLFRRRSF